MRVLMITAAVLAVSGCNRGSANNSSANKAAPATTNAAASAAPAAPAAGPAVATAGGLPAGFPKSDPKEMGIECATYLALAMQAGASPGGHDSTIMQQAGSQWAAALMKGGMTETQIPQAMEAATPALINTPAAQRDAAAALCVENAPDADPEG